MKGALLLFVALAACKNNTSHIYQGARWDPDKDCMDPVSSIDVLAGDDVPSTCTPTCLVAPAEQDGGRAIYVSSMCGPYPPLFDTTGAFPGCDRALAASTRGDACLADGGTSNAFDAGDASDAF
jgi:hypothetical protein